MSDSNALPIYKPEPSIAPLQSAFDFALSEWKRWCAEKGLPTFNAGQIYSWIFEKEVLSPDGFTNLSQATRTLLSEEFDWSLPGIESHLISKDTSEKFLLKTRDGNLVEMVVMPYENRTTLCISSQVGCRMGCTFCQTGKLGLMRNLSSGEILAQILLANRRLKELGHARGVTNIVFMGMGEPLDNYEAVLQACKTMVDPKAFGLSTARVTVSTSGLVPEIRRLAKDLPVRLAISLHTADDAKRSAMMPVNRTYSLDVLKEALLEYPAPKRYGITFEYVMIEGENDNILDAKKLVRFVHGLKAKVNLIPINHFPGIEMRRSEADRIQAFQKYLTDRSIPAPVRYSKGQDISGGCGQLAAKRKDELDRDPRELARERRRARRTESNASS